jgi:hypothetical protein
MCVSGRCPLLRAAVQHWYCSATLGLCLCTTVRLQWSFLLTALETFDPARGSSGVAFGTRSVVKLDYSILVRLALTGVTGGIVSWQCVCSREDEDQDHDNVERAMWSTTFSPLFLDRCYYPLLRARSLHFPPGPSAS